MSAKPGRIALMPLVVKPALAPAVVARFRKSVEAGLTLAALMTIPHGETENARLVTVGSCRTPACLMKLAVGIKAAYLFSTAVVRTGNSYKISFELFDPAGRVQLKQQGTCDICTLTEAVSKARAVAQDAGTALNAKHKALQPKPRPRPRVRPRPRPRPRPRLRPRPRPRPRPIPKWKPRPRPKPSILQAAWMSGIGGVASLVTGIVLLAMDEKPTCDRSRPEVSCPYRYNTGTAGAVFTALGAASMAASAVLFGIGYSRKKKETSKPRATVGVMPTREGIWAHAAFRF